MESTIGTEAQAVLYEAGIRSGQRSARVQLKAWEERSLAFIERWGKFYGSVGSGWFKLRRPS